jgi:hypothetical protein
MSENSGQNFPLYSRNTQKALATTIDTVRLKKHQLIFCCTITGLSTVLLQDQQGDKNYIAV